MEARNWIGIIIILFGVILQPIGWMYIQWLTIVSFVFIFIGVFVFATQKYIEKTEDAEFNSGGGSSSGSGMPGDVHDHSGWGHGGRSESSDFGDGGDGE